MSNEATADLAAVLLVLELKLMDPAVRANRIRVSELLADEFQEFGSSGRVWSRESILDLLANETDWLPPIIDEFTIQTIDSGAALVTYKTSRADPNTAHRVERTLRSSLWIFRGDRWQVLFHQGTKIPGIHP